MNYIGMNNSKMVIHMEFDGEASWEKTLGEVWLTQILGQWDDWLTNPPSGEDASNINCIICSITCY